MVVASVTSMWIMQAAVVAASLAVPVLAPQVAAGVGLAPSYVGYYTALVFLVAVTAALVVPRVIERFGPVRTGQASVLLAAGGLAAIAAGTIPMLVLSAPLIGLGYAAVNPAGSQLLQRYSPAHLRNTVFSLKQTSVPVAGAIAGAALPFAAGMLGWQGALAVAALLFVPIAAAMQVWRRLDAGVGSSGAAAGHGLLQPLKLVLSVAPLRRLVLASVVFVAVQFCYTSFFVTYVVEHAAVSVLSAGTLLSLGLLVSGIGRALWGVVADRTSPQLVLVTAGFAMAAVAVAACLVSEAWSTAAVAALSIGFGATSASWNGVLLAEVARQAGPRAVSTATSGSMVCLHFGALAGPAVFSGILDATGSYAAGFLILAALCVASGVQLLRAGR